MNNQNSGIGLLVTALLNPAVGAAVGIGLLGFGVYKLLSDDEELQNGDEFGSSDISLLGTGGPTTTESLEKPNTSARDAEVSGTQKNGLLSEAQKKDMIRRVMSELGKRSAAERARRRAALEQNI
ncbi:MAG: hypothetical protein HUJ27_01010 [Rhodobacteraceae bacterium]|nr:hypothetical protein [Paracoccaceae bacterium]